MRHWKSVTYWLHLGPFRFPIPKFIYARLAEKETQ